MPNSSRVSRSRKVPMNSRVRRRSFSLVPSQARVLTTWSPVTNHCRETRLSQAGGRKSAPCRVRSASRRWPPISEASLRWKPPMAASVLCSTRHSVSRACRRHRGPTIPSARCTRDRDLLPARTDAAVTTGSSPPPEDPRVERVQPRQHRYQPAPVFHARYRISCAPLLWRWSAPVPVPRIPSARRPLGTCLPCGPGQQGLGRPMNGLLRRPSTV